MKRIMTILFILSTVAFFATTAEAGVLDTIKQFGGSVGWTVVALILTGLIGLGGIATHAKWFSGICIAVGTLFTDFGLALQDGKIESAELKKARDNVKNIREAWKTK
jgi:hypothetical protein